MKMNAMTRKAAAALVAALATGLAHGALETSDAGYAGPFIDLASRVDLCACGTPTTTAQELANYGLTFGAVDLPGMVFTRSFGETNYGGAVLGQGLYRLGAIPGVNNGSFGAGAVYAGLDGWTGYMDFRLTGGPVSEFGAYVNYLPDFAEAEGEPFAGSPYIAALDAQGNVIEAWDLAADAPISTPGGFNEFVFRGIARDSADIYGLRFGNSYIIAAGAADGGLPTPVAAVPEPGTYALMLVGLGALAVVARRRRGQEA